jgi:outer membrane protein assembly factor BamD (BamD/ComL family)
VYGIADATDTLLLAEQKLSEGKADEAITLLQARAKPWSDDAKYLLARAWFKKGDYNSCIAQLEDILRGGERVFLDMRWKAQLLQAEAFLKTGDREQAKALLDAFLKADTDNPNKKELLEIAQKLRQNL